jgi:hypothetical protein
MCEKKQNQLTAYRNHIGQCYEFLSNSEALDFPNKGEFYGFLKQHGGAEKYLVDLGAQVAQMHQVIL